MEQDRESLPKSPEESQAILLATVLVARSTLRVLVDSGFITSTTLDGARTIATSSFYQSDTLIKIGKKLGLNSEQLARVNERSRALINDDSAEGGLPLSEA